MGIPNFNDYGVLPEGIYSCNLGEVKKFCCFGNTKARCNLYKKLQDYVYNLSQYKIPCEIIVDGSFITNKDTPSDIDLIVVTPFDWIPASNIANDCFALLSSDYIKRIYGFNMFWAFNESDTYDITIDFYKEVKHKPGIKKGLLKVII